MRKRTVLLLVFCILLLSVAGCSASNSVIRSLPSYKTAHTYTESAGQDHMDHTIYVYGSLDRAVLDNSIYFQKFLPEDAGAVQAYLEDFEERVAALRTETPVSELAMHYEFDLSQIGENDYYYIETADQKFANYSVYFVDMDTSTIYYFHNHN